MEWQSAALAVQILLIVIGWSLFQHARSQLTAQAAETPAVMEMKSLHAQVRVLLEQIERTSDQSIERLEKECAKARQLLQELEYYNQQGFAQPALPIRPSIPVMRELNSPRGQIYEMADRGEPPAVIARRMGLSEGMVETMLGMRLTPM